MRHLMTTVLLFVKLGLTVVWTCVSPVANGTERLFHVLLGHLLVLLEKR